jgi:hypothetical protein
MVHSTYDGHAKNVEFMFVTIVKVAASTKLTRYFCKSPINHQS